MLSSEPSCKMHLNPDQWVSDPATGLLELKESAIKSLISNDPIEKWYILDPEPIAR